MKKTQTVDTQKTEARKLELKRLAEKLKARTGIKGGTSTIMVSHHY